MTPSISRKVFASSLVQRRESSHCATGTVVGFRIVNTAGSETASVNFKRAFISNWKMEHSRKHQLQIFINMTKIPNRKYCNMSFIQK